MLCIIIDKQNTIWIIRGVASYEIILIISAGWTETLNLIIPNPIAYNYKILLYKIGYIIKTHPNNEIIPAINIPFLHPFSFDV